VRAGHVSRTGSHLTAHVRALKGEFRFYAFEPPYDDIAFNTAERFFNMAERIERIQTGVETISSQAKQLTDPHLGRRAIEDVIWAFEEFLYWEPALLDEKWAGDAWSALAHAYVRVRDGRLDDADLLTNELLTIIHETQTAKSNIATDLRGYFLQKGQFIERARVHSSLQADVEEAHDLVILNYYATALFVLSRAAERAVHEIGVLMGIEAIRRGSTTSWEDASFASKKEALATAEWAKKKVITKRDALEIQILIDYRNSLAHKDYARLDHKEGKRAIQNALALLEKLSKFWEKLGTRKRKLRTVEIRP